MLRDYDTVSERFNQSAPLLGCQDKGTVLYLFIDIEVILVPRFLEVAWVKLIKYWLPYLRHLTKSTGGGGYPRGDRLRCICISKHLQPHHIPLYTSRIEHHDTQQYIYVRCDHVWNPDMFGQRFMYLVFETRPPRRCIQ